MGRAKQKQPPSLPHNLAQGLDLPLIRQQQVYADECFSVIRE